MYVSKRALSILYHSLDRTGQKELIEIEKKIDRYTVAERRRETEKEGVSVLIEVKPLPASLKERLLNLVKRSERNGLACYPFVLSFEDDFRKNRKFPKPRLRG